MKNKQYEGYPEIHKNRPGPVNNYEVSRVIEELGKEEAECKNCPDYPNENNNYEPCGCMRVNEANACVCSEKV